MMVKIKWTFLIISIIGITILFIRSSANHVTSIRDFQAWFNKPENGFIKKRNVNGLEFSVQYRPPELMLINEIKREEALTLHMIDSLSNLYGDSDYFLLTIRPDPENFDPQGDLIKSRVENYSQYSEAIKYLSFYLDENIELLVGEDTLVPNFYHYERGFEVSNKQSFLVSFPRTDNSSQSKKFIFDDFVFYSGRLKFNFNNNQNYPEIREII